MNPDAVAYSLWIGSLLVAVDPAVDPLPDSLDEFATTAAAARSYPAPLSRGEAQLRSRGCATLEVP